MKKIVVFLMMMMSATMAMAQVGTWKTYLAYHDVTEIEKAGDIIYVLASENLYAYNTNDESIQTYDKINFLNDSKIIHIAWCQEARRLVIVYSNYNIDLLNTDNTVVNIPDYNLKSTMLDKTVNSVYVNGSSAYLSTGFGIVRINVKDANISEVYNLDINVINTFIKDGNIYANSREKGCYEAPLNSNLLDKANWKWITNFQGYQHQPDADLLQLVSTLNPGGPKYNYFNFMNIRDNRLFSAGGYYRGGVILNRPGCIQVLDENDEWQIYQDNIAELTNYRYVDLDGFDIDPLDNQHLIAYGRTGLYEFNNGVYTNSWNTGNSPINTALGINNPASYNNYCMTFAGKFDSEGNFWCLNSQTADGKTAILCLTKDGEWKAFPHQELIVSDLQLRKPRSLGSMENIIFDSTQRMWFVNNHWDLPSFYAYDTDADQLTIYKKFINEDGTEIEANYIRCITEDKDGNLWIGSDQGPFYLSKADRDTDPDDVRFEQVKVPRNDGTNLADYLLSGVDIQCIAIDGGNRKWFGTGNDGLYLIANDNTTQIAHYTAENSSLLSNTIEALAINNTTGQLYIGTDKGLCVFMTDATQPTETMQKDNVWAYPNPVQPNYNGPITIVGLSYNAYVKITNTNGSLVNEGQSSGGSYTWDGNDQDGRKVASGVYVVHAATEEGKKGVVCKIAVVR